MSKTPPVWFDLIYKWKTIHTFWSLNITIWANSNTKVFFFAFEMNPVFAIVPRLISITHQLELDSGHKQLYQQSTWPLLLTFLQILLVISILHVDESSFVLTCLTDDGCIKWTLSVYQFGIRNKSLSLISNEKETRQRHCDV